MEWHRLGVDEVGEWAAAQQTGPPPPEILFAPLDFQRVNAGLILDRLAIRGEIQPRSGTVRLHSNWQSAQRYLELTRPPRELQDDDVQLEFVQRQASTWIAGVPSIGPGGRVTQYARGFVDVAIRPVATFGTSGSWRDPVQVQAIAAALRGELSVAFGYAEPSAYETADRADAAYFVRADGPRWQDCAVIPADAELPVD